MIITVTDNDIHAGEEIVENLKGRKGFDNIFDSLDDELRHEILVEIVQTIAKYRHEDRQNNE